LPLQRRLVICNGAVAITVAAVATAVFEGKIQPKDDI